MASASASPGQVSVAAAAIAAAVSSAAPVEKPSSLPPDQQEWAQILEAENADEEEEEAPPRLPAGQVKQITSEVDQDLADPAVFRVDGKDKSWFLQKGAISFERKDPNSFQLEVEFLGDAANRFDDAYAELSRVEQ